MGKVHWESSRKDVGMDNFVKHINPLSKPVVYTAEALWAKFVDYCCWCESNAIELPAATSLKGKKQVDCRTEKKSTVKRPYLISDFSLWANIDNWEAFKSKNMRSDSFAKVIDYIEKTIKNQQTIGVITGMYDTAVKKSYFV